MSYKIGEEIELKSFVEAFNDCKETVYAMPKNKKKNLYVELAKDFDVLNNNMNANNVEPDNREFYCYLLRHCKDGSSYTFLEKDENGTEIKANINVFEPYDEKKEKINQKWHVMVSLLAFLDAAKNDKGLNKMDMFKSYSKKDFSKFSIIEKDGKKRLKLQKGNGGNNLEMMEQIMIILNKYYREDNYT